MKTATHHRWDEIAPDHPMQDLERRRVIGEQAMISLVRLTQGCSVPSHQHPNEQFSHVLRGRLRFGLGEPGTSAYRETEVGAGEVLHLPGGVPHAALALEDCEVLDVFAPPSETTGIDGG